MSAENPIDQPTAVHATSVIERAYPAPPERVFAAFSDPAKKRRWFAEGDTHTVDAYELELRVGGSERIVSTFGPGTPIAGTTLTFESRYLDVVPDRRIVFAQTLDRGTRRISAALVTIELLRSGGGTELVCTHQGTFFEGADGPRMREGGWRTLFERLAAELAA
jgi:uncharacterized protein YndB with AHSA1/START domain